METWCSTISFAIYQPGNISEYIHACSRLWPFGPQVRWPTTRSSSLAACIQKYFRY